jgi:hypothetical protein
LQLQNTTKIQKKGFTIMKNENMGVEELYLAPEETKDGDKDE